MLHYQMSWAFGRFDWQMVGQNQSPADQTEKGMRAYFIACRQSDSNWESVK